MSRQPVFNPYCPNGDSFTAFYACDHGTRFLGCCADITGTEVCADGCTNVQPASFDKDYYDQVTRNGCQDSQGQWYTCQDTSTPFLGCCKSNPCSNNGCPEGDLVPAQLSRNQTEKAAFSTMLAEKSPAPERRVGAIIGGAVGGSSFVIAACALFWFRKRKLRQQANRPPNNKDVSEGTSTARDTFVSQILIHSNSSTSAYIFSLAYTNVCCERLEACSV